PQPATRVAQKPMTAMIPRGPGSASRCASELPVKRDDDHCHDQCPGHHDEASFQKSPNRYPPGPYTIRLTPLAKGVRKDALAPMATPSIMGIAETCSSEAVARPIGIMTSAEDVLEINWLMTADIKKIPASTTCGPAPPSAVTTWSPMSAAAPVLV